MNYLFVGDIHNHNYIFDNINRLDDKYQFDNIIFVGDYVDDWNTTNEDSLNTLDKVINLKKSNENKYTLLIGNHELSYLGYPCSGHRYENDTLVNKKLLDNIKYFDICKIIDLNNCNSMFNYWDYDNAKASAPYIISHAGFTDGYFNILKKVYGVEKDSSIDILKEISKIIKDELINEGTIYYTINQASFNRGGNSNYGSFLWADKIELLDYPTSIFPNQIVGHSPVRSITNYRNINEDKWFIDTYSNYRDGREYGDKSYLAYIDNNFKILY